MKKAAMIGMGAIYPIHLAAITMNPEIQLCAVCDINPDKSKDVPKGTAFYTDYIEMVEKEQPDCVHICLPHYLHVPVSRDLVERGIHVFCEKPVALHTEEAVGFAALEEQHPDIHIGICLQNRLNESVEVLKAFIESGEYGAFQGARGFVPWTRPKSYYDEQPWRGTWKEAGGGCMINQSVHTLDLLYHLGGKIKGVKATVSQLMDLGIEVEDTVVARLDYENGANGLFFATNVNVRNESVQLTIWMEKATFCIVDSVLYKVLPDGEKEALQEDQMMPGSKFYYGASHKKLIEQFYRALEDGSGEYIHVKDAVMSIRLIDAIQKSGRENRYVPV